MLFKATYESVYACGGRSYARIETPKDYDYYKAYMFAVKSAFSLCAGTEKLISLELIKG